MSIRVERPRRPRWPQPHGWSGDTFSFAVLALVSMAAMLAGARPLAVAIAFGDGLWSLMPFTMQMVFVVISGHVVARAPPTARLIRSMARMPSTGRGAVVYVAVVSMMASLLSWALGLVFSGLLARELARRRELRMDYRAAGTAAYLGICVTWCMRISSSAAQLQANSQSLRDLLIPVYDWFTERFDTLGLKEARALLDDLTS